MKSRGRTHKGSFEAMLTTLRNFHHSHERQKQRQKQRQSTENDETIKQLIWLLATDLSDEKTFKGEDHLVFGGTEGTIRKIDSQATVER